MARAPPKLRPFPAPLPNEALWSERWHTCRLPQEVETALFRVLQERLTNVHRHSGSKRADVLIRLDGQSVLATIRDYVRGLAAHQFPNVPENRARGVGLISLREGIAALGGLLEVLSAEPRGSDQGQIVNFLAVRL